MTTARRGDVVALSATRIGFAREAADEALAVVLQNDVLCATASSLVIAQLERVPSAPDFPAWVTLEQEAALPGRWIVMTDEVRRIAIARLAPGVRGRLSGGAMRRIDRALRWVLAL